MTDQLWVVRHGERRDSVDLEWAETAQRPHDPPLTDLGRWAAWRVGRRFAEQGPDLDAIYASPFRRCVETAEEIATETGDRVYLEAGLGEHRNADWFDEHPAIQPAASHADRFEPIENTHDSLVEPAFPETHDEAMARVGRAARALADRTDGPLLLVGHGITVAGVVRAFAGDAELADAPLCGLTRFDREDGEWHLAFSGDTAHLDAED